MFCSLMSVFMYFSGFESFAPLERWCDFAKFWCGKKKLVAVNTTKLTSSNIMRSLSIHCLFTHWHLKLYKKINKKCEFNILVLVLLVTRSVCGTFYIFLLFVLYVTRWGMWNPFYIFLAFDLYVTRWVCETPFYMFLVFVLYVTRWVC